MFFEVTVEMTIIGHCYFCETKKTHCNAMCRKRKKTTTEVVDFQFSSNGVLQGVDIQAAQRDI